MRVFYKSYDHFGILAVLAIFMKNGGISSFTVSDISCYKNCLRHDELVKSGRETKEGLIITHILILYAEPSGENSYKGFKSNYS